MPASKRPLPCEGLSRDTQEVPLGPSRRVRFASGPLGCDVDLVVRDSVPAGFFLLVPRAEQGVVFADLGSLCAHATTSQHQRCRRGVACSGAPGGKRQCRLPVEVCYSDPVSAKASVQAPQDCASEGMGDKVHEEDYKTQISWLQGAAMVQRQPSVAPVELRNCRLAWFDLRVVAPLVFQFLARLTKLGAAELLDNGQLESHCDFEDCQLAEYGPGHHYQAWHRDGDLCPTSREDLRRLTALLMLSDPAEYTHGEFQVRFPAENKRGTRRIFNVPLSRGDVLLFPAALLEHRVSPVLSGLRRTATLWLSQTAETSAKVGSVVHLAPQPRRFRRLRLRRRIGWGGGVALGDAVTSAAVAERKFRRTKHKVAALLRKTARGGEGGAVFFRLVRKRIARLLRSAAGAASRAWLLDRLGVCKLIDLAIADLSLHRQELSFVESLAELLNDLAEALWAAACLRPRSKTRRVGTLRALQVSFSASPHDRATTRRMAVSKIAVQAFALLRALVLPYILNLLHHPAYEIADSVEPFLGSLLADANEARPHLADADVDTVAPTLEMARDVADTVVRQASRLLVFPNWFCHMLPIEELDKRHVVFVEFRQSLLRLLRHAFSLTPPLLLSAAEAAVARIEAGVSGSTDSGHGIETGGGSGCDAHDVIRSSTPWELEADLVLLHSCRSFLHRAPSGRREDSIAFERIFARLLSCDRFGQFPHWAVQSALMDLYLLLDGRVERNAGAAWWTYAAATATALPVTRNKRGLGPTPSLAAGAPPIVMPQLLRRVLEALWDKRGLRSADPRLSKRASFVMLHIVRGHCELLAPHSMEIFVELKDVLLSSCSHDLLCGRGLNTNCNLPPSLIKSNFVKDTSHSWQALSAGQEHIGPYDGCLRLEDTMPLYEALGELASASEGDGLALRVAVLSPIVTELTLLCELLLSSGSLTDNEPAPTEVSAAAQALGLLMSEGLEGWRGVELRKRTLHLTAGFFEAAAYLLSPVRRGVFAKHPKLSVGGIDATAATNTTIDTKSMWFARLGEGTMEGRCRELWENLLQIAWTILAQVCTRAPPAEEDLALRRALRMVGLHGTVGGMRHAEYLLTALGSHRCRAAGGQQYSSRCASAQA